MPPPPHKSTPWAPVWGSKTRAPDSRKYRHFGHAKSIPCYGDKGLECRSEPLLKILRTGAGRPEPEGRSRKAGGQRELRRSSRQVVVFLEGGNPEAEGRIRKAGAGRPGPEGRGREAGRPEPECRRSGGTSAAGGSFLPAGGSPEPGGRSWMAGAGRTEVRRFGGRVGRG